MIAVLKNVLFMRTATMIAVLTSYSLHEMIAALNLRSAVKIAVLIKFTIYEDCDHVFTKMSCF